MLKHKGDENILFTKDEFRALGRSRYCLHASNDDILHHMLILLSAKSYVRPHRHVNKNESYLIINGTAAYLEFDDYGKVTFSTKIEPYCANTESPFVIYKECSEKWHTIISITPFVYFSETTTGPFDKNDTEYASWAPAEDSSQNDIDEFLFHLKKVVK